MDEGSNGLDEIIFGISTAPYKSQYNWTLHYFRQQRKYKRVVVLYLFLALFGFAYSLYQIMSQLVKLGTRASSWDSTYPFFILDDTLFTLICLKSSFQLAWAHRTNNVHLLLLNSVISTVRLGFNPHVWTIFRCVYVWIISVVMYWVNQISAGIEGIAIRLKPDETDPDVRFTV